MKTGWLRKWGWVVCLCLSVAQPVGAEDQALPYRLAVVNLLKVLEQAPQSAAASKYLESVYSGRESALVQEQLDLEQAQEAFRLAAPELQQNERVQRERELRTMRRDYSRKLEDLNEEIRVAKDSALEKVQDQVERAVDTVRAQEHIDVVFRESDYLVASARVDISNKVLEYLKQQFDQEQAQKPAEKPATGE